jgi:protein involved in polysaccharide export with SLBB domain
MNKRPLLMLITGVMWTIAATYGHSLDIGLPGDVPTTIPSISQVPSAPQFPKVQVQIPQAPPEPATAPSPSNAGSALPQVADYIANLKSDVFGANLFTGAFALQGSSQFNPDYVVAIGDRVQVRLWGSFQYDAVLLVDPHGNIFLPNMGPVKVLGVRNKDLQQVIEIYVAKYYRSNVASYASLAAAQPVRVFVSGFVNRPGLYGGTSMASLLYYLDQAGGIDPDRGSFLNVQVKRGDTVRTTVNLYEFLLEGRMPLIQFSDGDVVFVSSRQNTVKVSGLTENAKRFEFSDSARTVADLIAVAKPLARSTHVRVVRNKGSILNTEYYSLADAGLVTLQNGDDLEFTADKKIGTISVRVQGEHLSDAKEYTLPNGARLGDLLKQIRFSDNSDTDNLQLFRLTVKERQRTMFATALRSLEASVLTARSATSDEARLRKDEADLILQWIARAKTIEPSGQVVIATASARDAILLENGDEIRVPIKDGLVLINGEVLFPTTILFDPRLDVEDYVQRGGGFTQNANTSRVVIAHRDGTFDEHKGSSLFGTKTVRTGDEILVLPKIDVKYTQILKDFTQILFQIAVTANVVLGFH